MAQYASTGVKLLLEALWYKGRQLRGARFRAKGWGLWPWVQLAVVHQVDGGPGDGRWEKTRTSKHIESVCSQGGGNAALDVTRPAHCCAPLA